MVLSGDGEEVLLHLRGYIRLWSLPGGYLQPGEAWEESVIRETYKETGYQGGDLFRSLDDVHAVAEVT